MLKNDMPTANNCHNCGVELLPDAKFCASCGSEVVVSNEKPSSGRPLLTLLCTVIAIIFNFFLGSIIYNIINGTGIFYSLGEFGAILRGLFQLALMLVFPLYTGAVIWKKMKKD